MQILLLLIVVIFIGCNNDSVDDETINGNSKIFITLQDSDYLAIVRASDLAVLDTIKIDLNEMDMMGMNEAPHDVAIDNLNNYFFTTAMMGGHVGK